MTHPNRRLSLQSSLDGAHLPGAPDTPPALSYKPLFSHPRNHGEEIANLLAWRDWDSTQKRNRQMTEPTPKNRYDARMKLKRDAEAPGSKSDELVSSEYAFNLADRFITALERAVEIYSRKGADK